MSGKVHPSRPTPTVRRQEPPRPPLPSLCAISVNCWVVLTPPPPARLARPPAGSGRVGWEPGDMGWGCRREAALGFSEPGSSPILTQPVGRVGLRDPICDLGVVTVDTSQDRGITHLFINLSSEHSTPCSASSPLPTGSFLATSHPRSHVCGNFSSPCCLPGPGTLILLPTVRQRGLSSLTATASDWPSFQGPGLISNPIFCHGTSSSSCWWPARPFQHVSSGLPPAESVWSSHAHTGELPCTPVESGLVLCRWVCTIYVRA